MLQYFETLTDDSGNSLLGATVTVTNYPGGGLATIYNTNGTASPIAASTVMSDITGQVSFYVPDGAYTLTYSYKATVYKTKSPVQMLDPMGFVVGTDSGIANAYVLTNAAYPASLYPNLKVTLVIGNSNAGASTLNLNATGNQSIQIPGGGALPPGSLVAGGIYQFEWTGTVWQLLYDVLTQQVIGGILYPQTAAEAAAGVVPTSYDKAPWRGEDIRRFGAVGDGATNNAAFLTTANSIGAALYIPPGTYLVNSNLVLNVPLFFDSLAILKPAAGITITINAPVYAGLWKIFDQSAGGTIAGKIRAPAIYPEWFGALGNGKRGNNGTMLGTAFSDANAAFVAADVGKVIFIVAPPYTTFPTSLNTIQGYVSGTAVTLNVAPPWASTCAFTASIGPASTTMTVTAIASGTLLPGQTITGAAGGTTILYQLTGAAGSTGTYKVSISQTFASGPLTAAIPLTYYFGADDTIPINAANALVGSQGASLGSSVNYNLYSINGTLSFTGPSIYLMTGQAVIGGTINTTAHRWEGLQGRPTIALCINNAATDCILLGAAGSADAAVLKDISVDCCFAGRDALVIGGFEAPMVRNVDIHNAQRDGISITPGASSFVQQGMFEVVQSINAGRHTIYVNPAAGSFANECKWTTCVTGSPSQRQAGGTALYFDAIAGNGCDTWTFDVVKFTNGWNGDPNFQPLPNAIFVAPGAAIFSGSGMKLINCYAEQSGPVLGASAPAIKVSATATANIQADGFAALGWGADLERARFDGASIFTVGNGASQDVCVLAAGQVWQGEISFYLNDGTNGTYDRRSFTVIPGVNGTITTLGAVSSPGAVTYTITANGAGGSTHITVNNTGAVPFTLQYSALSKHKASGAGFVY